MGVGVWGCVPATGACISCNALPGQSASGPQALRAHLAPEGFSEVALFWSLPWQLDWFFASRQF